MDKERNNIMANEKRIKDLDDSIAELAGISKASAKEVRKGIFKEIKSFLKDEGDHFSIPEFGSFSLYQRKATRKINPRTKQSIDVPAKKAVKFKPSHTWTDHL